MGMKPRGPHIKRFWIIKHRPDKSQAVYVSGGGNVVYHSREAAEKDARNMAAETRRGYVVLEVVSCFDVVDVVPVRVT